MTLATPDWEIDEIVAAAKKYGYDGVEIFADKGHKHGIGLQTPPRQRKGIKRTFEDSGIAISCMLTSLRFSSPDRSVREENLQRLVLYADLARDLGAPYLRIFGGRRSESSSWEEAKDCVTTSLHKAQELLQGREVMALVETHDDFSLGAQVAEIVARVNKGNIGALWDIMHPFSRGEEPEETYKYLWKFVRHFHISDRAGKEEKSKEVPVGEGVMPIREIITIAKEENFPGFLSGQWWPKLGEPDAVLPQFIRRLKKFEAEVS